VRYLAHDFSHINTEFSVLAEDDNMDEEFIRPAVSDGDNGLSTEVIFTAFRTSQPELIFKRADHGTSNLKRSEPHGGAPSTVQASYPNPFRSSFIVHKDDVPNGLELVVCRNVQGVEQSVLVTRHEDGSMTFLPDPAARPGLYLLELTGREDSRVVKMCRIR
jgi:hypothetical protein